MPSQRWKPLVRRALRARGFDVVRYLPARRLKVLRESGATHLIDIGANRGQYGVELRKQGYGGPLISFEPLADVFVELLRVARADAEWQCHQIALGDRDGEAAMHRSADPACSSMLEVQALHATKNPGWEQINDEAVPIRRLDSIAESLLAPENTLFLKLDVQGFELPVLEGASQTLARVVALETELSLAVVYDGQALLHDVSDWLYERGFGMVWLDRIYNDPMTDHLLQVDALFLRDSVVEKQDGARRRSLAI